MIATITFHWATNYGAVIQAYALQKWLLENGFNTEIIDYMPKRERFISFLVNIRDGKTKELIKGLYLSRFRKKELKLSKKRFNKYTQLKECAHAYSAVICGSDQIWNTYFTLKAEGKPTFSYFIDFVAPETRRISYASSFGTESLNEEFKTLIYPKLSMFNSLSVRENSAVSILNDIGIKAKVVCDPTLLLVANDYNKLLRVSTNRASDIFVYKLHNDLTCNQVSNYLSNKYKLKNNNPEKVLTLYEWLRCLRDSQIIITNSFHGIMMSLIFNTPFIAVLIRGSGMNDRIKTILSEVGLQNRIIDCFDTDSVEAIYQESIDWIIVNDKLSILRQRGIQFLNDALDGIQRK